MSTLPKEAAAGVPRPAGSPALASVESPSVSEIGEGVRGRLLAGLGPGSVIDGRYRVIRFLNQGGNGVVHEVEHLRTGRRLAMKTLVDDASAARLEQEARATAIMRNPHVVRITDMGPAPGSRAAPYLVMELLEGQSLRDLLDDAGQLPLELTVNIALQVCECLAEAHGRSVIHRDLKPENLFLQKSPWPGQHDVVVLDFGVMKVAGEGPIPKGSLTRTGSTVGTPYYMSLEQLRNSSAVDARADIYSLGVVLYECLAGRKPFLADTIGDLVYALCSGPPTPLARLRPDLPADVCNAVMGALKMNRDDRPASMAELGAALLPHGHQAFGLWLRAGEGAPPVAAAPPAPLGDLPAPRTAAPAGLPPPRGPLPTSPNPPARAPLPTSPNPLTTTPTPVQLVPPRAPTPFGGVPVAAPPPPPTPVPAAPPTPDEGEGTTVTGVAAIRDGEDDGEPAAETPARRDRDTPTEMYKGAFAGDRDTPTRALPAPSTLELDAAARKAIAAAEEEDPDRMQTYRIDPPRFGVPDPPPGAQPGAPRVVTAPETLISPVQPPPPLRTTAPLPSPQPPPRFDAPQDAARGAPTAPFPLVEPQRPGWQQTLDRALASVGRFIDGLVKRVRAQPRPMQIAIVGTMVLIVVLVLILLAVLIFR